MQIISTPLMNLSHSISSYFIFLMLDQVIVFQTASHILLMDCEISLVGHYQHIWMI